ncbi:hypothetical protein [Mesorhizobium sp.]|uniref:hypothetical protein n=1 Tax=Mesorhizobium sp. TaxID=1871066 RepID=UPI000FE71E00|nr:hypothetical protein [Mesorhizobium sp.]RWK53154.1 MAG: hypothetical protein EOR48_22605 [Mesorhizobium sp.]TIP43531.1 MAG: hypothetical protein E5X62_18395 [Mesorhizobium sp.]
MKKFFYRCRAGRAEPLVPPRGLLNGQHRTDGGADRMNTQNSARRSARVMTCATVALGIAAGVISSVHAAVIFDKKLGQFGFEPREVCVKWASGKWPWPIKGGWKTCVGWKIEFLQHAFHLVIDGPEPEGAIRHVLAEAATVAATAAAATGIGTPADPASRVAAALTAAKAAFVVYLKARGLERLLTQYDVRVDHRTFWS